MDKENDILSNRMFNLLLTAINMSKNIPTESVIPIVANFVSLIEDKVDLCIEKTGDIKQKKGESRKVLVQTLKTSISLYRRLFTKTKKCNIAAKFWHKNKETIIKGINHFEENGINAKNVKLLCNDIDTAFGTI